MNTNLSAAIATERHQRLVDEAAAYRRGNRRSHKASHANHRHTRVTAFLKDLASASL